jgi:hypothetical protein
VQGVVLGMGNDLIYVFKNHFGYNTENGLEENKTGQNKRLFHTQG